MYNKTVKNTIFSKLKEKIIQRLIISMFLINQINN